MPPCTLTVYIQHKEFLYLDNNNNLDNNHFYVAQFMRESIVIRDVVGRHGCSNLLSSSEIIQYLATY